MINIYNTKPDILKPYELLNKCYQLNNGINRNKWLQYCIWLYNYCNKLKPINLNWVNIINDNIFNYYELIYGVTHYLNALKKIN